MNSQEATMAILTRFQSAGRVTDLRNDGIAKEYEGNLSELVRALRDTGLLHHLRGNTRGAVYITSRLGEIAIGH